MRKLFVLSMLLFSTAIFAQGTITGTVTDAELQSGLPGANVVVQGTTNGVITDFDGKFTLDVNASSGKLKISYLGYKTKTVSFALTDGALDLGVIALEASASALEQIVVVGKGVVDIAIGRQTPVAVSTITAESIKEVSGNMEFPSMLRSMPSVYANTSGGGYGDSNVRIRGFGQSNTAFLLNGQPINGMEDGKIYWSNWQGVKDIATAIQVQRGLGASKLAISSVGGTVNIVTETYNTQEKGYIQADMGNGNYYKTTAYYSTGKNEKGWASTYMLSYWEGDGNFYESTHGKGLTYFFSVGYKPSETHAFNFLITGAPQTHQQAYQGSIEDALKYGRDYNSNWGYLNGEVYNERTNFYHKPVMNLNWDWTMNDNSNLSTVLYASFGRGGGTGPLGYYDSKYNANGQINYDDIVAANKAVAPTIIGGNSYLIGQDGYPNNEGYLIRASMNNHFWAGAVSNFNHKINENWQFNIGLDYRNYHGDHYRQVVDFLGLDGWAVNNNASIPNGQYVFESFDVNLFDPTFETAPRDQRVDYGYSEDIAYIGGFGQIEYATDRFSAFLQGALSSQSHVRYDYFTYLLPEDQESEKVVNTGYNIKGGANYNITDEHNVFLNLGYYSRQPYHDNIYLNYSNQLNPLTENEEITGIEVGYGFSHDFIDVHVNGYYTVWGNRAQTRTTRLDLNNDGTDEEYFANFNGIEQTHMGIEVDFTARPIENLKINGFVSIGNWEYSANPIQSLYDSDDLSVVPSLSGKTSYVDGLKVGYAPQTSFTLGAEYEILDNLSVDADWYYYANLYAGIDPVRFTTKGNEVIKLPAYDLVRVGASYTWELNDGTSFTFRGNVRNLFNEVYLSSLSSNDPMTAGAKNFKGINASNKGYFGYDRQWSLSVRYNF